MIVRELIKELLEWGMDMEVLVEPSDYDIDTSKKLTVVNRLHPDKKCLVITGLDRRG